MSIKHACFISYPHPQQGKQFERIIDQLIEALENYLGFFITERVYIDKNRLRPGYNYDVAFSKAICESACMIVIYTSLYESSDYCLREFLAMEQIEEKRKQILGDKYDNTHRMIIPIVIKEDHIQDLPPKIKHIHYWDFSRHILRSIDPTKNRECEKLIIEIGKEILQHHHVLREAISISDCNEFEIPNTADALRSWGVISITPPDPPPFPGR